jgi:hypothetical protein
MYRYSIYTVFLKCTYCIYILYIDNSLRYLLVYVYKAYYFKKDKKL